jgi:nucleoside-diphosphate-sugar epimerase
MKILLLGASGFVGRNIIKFFPKTFIIYAAYNSNKPNFIKENIKYIKINLLQNKKFKSFDKLNFDGIIDCGWIGVFGIYRNDQVQKKNQKYTENLIKLIKVSKKVKFLISFGSQAEYGSNNKPITEKKKLKPQTLYGKEKIKKLIKLNIFCKKSNIRFVWFRIFSTYGDYEIKDWLIPYTIRNMILKKKLKFTDGKQKWDYLHISDIVSAVKLACINKKITGIFNLSSNKPVRVKTIIMKLKQFTKYNKNLSFGDVKYRKDQITYLNGDNKKLKSFKWKPRISIIKGLKSTILIFKKKLIKS